MGLEHIENEEYTQHERDLYAKIHENLNSCLNNTPFNYPDTEVKTNKHSLNLSISNLEVQLKQIPSLKMIQDIVQERAKVGPMILE